MRKLVAGLIIGAAIVSTGAMQRMAPVHAAGKVPSLQALNLRASDLPGFHAFEDLYLGPRTAGQLQIHFIYLARDAPKPAYPGAIVALPNGLQQVDSSLTQYRSKRYLTNLHTVVTGSVLTPPKHLGTDTFADGYTMGDANAPVRTVWVQLSFTEGLYRIGLTGVTNEPGSSYQDAMNALATLTRLGRIIDGRILRATR